MKVGIFTDFRFVSHTAPTGVGKHIVEMVQGLNRALGGQCFALTARDQAGKLGPLDFLPIRKIPVPWKLAEALWTLSGRPLADRWCSGLDWVYCPKNDFIPVGCARLAITIHGAPELDPAMPQSGTLAARLNRYRRRTSYKRIVQHADVVLTVSEFLKGQVVDWFGADPEHVHVVGNGVEPEYFEAGTKPRGEGMGFGAQPFVMCIGGLNFLDGGDTILGVAKVLQEKAPDLKVLVAGRQHEPALEAGAKLLPNLRLLGYVDSKRLAPLLRAAIALLYPTRYETFGIAAAEAMAVGTPVVTSRSTAVPEIVGEAGLYAASNEPEEMAHLLISLTNSSSLRTKHATAGLLRAKSFTWEACSKRLIEVLAK